MWLADWFTGAAGGHMPTPLLAVRAQAVEAASDVPTSTIVAGVLAIASAGIAAWLSSRGMLRTATVQREANYDKRVDERNAHLEKRNEELYAELHRYRELYAQLRLDVRAHGLDPDKLGKGADSEAPG